MGFYVRKSIGAGPFRFNFSSGGVGVSVGVKGLRIGTGPRGHYIHAGVGGLYYRATLAKAGAKKGVQQPHRPQTQPQPSAPQYITDGVVMREIESGDVMDMRDETFANVLDENQRQAIAETALRGASSSIRNSRVPCWESARRCRACAGRRCFSAGHPDWQMV